MRELPDNARLEVYDAIFKYVSTGVKPEMSAIAATAFAFIQADIDLERAKTENLRLKRVDAINRRWGKGDTTASNQQTTTQP